MRFPFSLPIFLGLLIFIPSASLLNHQTGQSTEQPKVIDATVPTYPPLANIHAFGVVVVEIEINAKGEVVNANALSGHPLLKRASEEAAKRWRFEPISTGKNNQKLNLTFDFKNPEVFCNRESVFVNPYYVEIYFTYKHVKPSETISHIPPDAKGKRCPVHRELLKKDKVGLWYGEIQIRNGYLEAEKKLFPYANTEAYGGHASITEVTCDGTEIQVSPKYAEVLYCSKCRVAQARWSKSHP